MSTEPLSTEPLLRITKGDASPEDVGALIALFAAIGTSGDSEPANDDIHAWSSKENMFRHFPIPGPGAWRASGMAQ